MPKLVCLFGVVGLFITADMGVCESHAGANQPRSTVTGGFQQALQSQPGNTAAVPDGSVSFTVKGQPWRAIVVNSGTKDERRPAVVADSDS